GEHRAERLDVLEHAVREDEVEDAVGLVDRVGAGDEEPLVDPGRGGERDLGRIGIDADEAPAKGAAADEQRRDAPGAAAEAEAPTRSHGGGNEVKVRLRLVPAAFAAAFIVAPWAVAAPGSTVFSAAGTNASAALAACALSVAGSAAGAAAAGAGSLVAAGRP